MPIVAAPTERGMPARRFNLSADELERDSTAAPGFLGLEDEAHATRADEADQAVARRRRLEPVLISGVAVDGLRRHDHAGD